MTPPEGTDASTPKTSGMTYAAAGVDIEAGDAVVDRIKPVLKRH